MPVVSQSQRGAMAAAAEGKSTLGIPAKVGKEYIDATPAGLKLPPKVGAKKPARPAKRLGDMF